MFSRKFSAALMFALLVAHVTYPSQKSESKIETKQPIQKPASEDDQQSDYQWKEKLLRAAFQKRGVLIIPRTQRDVTPEDIFLLCTGWAVEEDNFMREYYAVEAEVFANPDKYAPEKRAQRARRCPILMNCLNWLFGSAKNK